MVIVIQVLYLYTMKMIVIILKIVIGLIIGIVRIGAGAHFLSDVLMSFVVVNVILHITRYLFAKWEKTKA